jgi:hypothetical protein
MHLIFEYCWGDEPYYGQEVFAVEYSSKDDLALDFQIACEEAIKNPNEFGFYEFKFFIQKDLSLTDFMSRVPIKGANKSGNIKYEWRYNNPPTIYTLEEWLQQTTVYPVKNSQS